MLPETQKTTYEAFLAATADNNALGPETTILLQLATAMALGCYP